MLHAQTWEGTHRLQLLEANASVIQCPTLSARKVLQSLKERHSPGLFDVLEAEGMSQAYLMKVS